MNFSKNGKQLSKFWLPVPVASTEILKNIPDWYNAKEIIDELLSNSLCEDEKKLVDKILFKLDAVFILGSLGMLIRNRKGTD